MHILLHQFKNICKLFTCLGKSCSFNLPCVSFVNVYQFVSVFLFPFELGVGMWGKIYECLIIAVYFTYSTLYLVEYNKHKVRLNPTSHPQNQKGEKQTHKLINVHAIGWLVSKERETKERKDR